MSVEDKRIREFAYQIWESEGKPEGQEERHWGMARKLAEAESLAPKSAPRKRAAAKGKTSADVSEDPKRSAAPAKRASAGKSAALPGAEPSARGKSAAKKPRAAAKKATDG